MGSFSRAPKKIAQPVNGVGEASVTGTGEAYITITWLNYEPETLPKKSAPSGQNNGLAEYSHDSRIRLLSTRTYCMLYIIHYICYTCYTYVIHVIWLVLPAAYFYIISLLLLSCFKTRWANLTNLGRSKKTNSCHNHSLRLTAYNMEHALAGTNIEIDSSGNHGTSHRDHHPGYHNWIYSATFV